MVYYPALKLSSGNTDLEACENGFLVIARQALNYKIKKKKKEPLRLRGEVGWAWCTCESANNGFWIRK
jgi:hypothetical protein